MAKIIFSVRDAARLASLDYEFAVHVRAVLQRMAEIGHPMFITSARRTTAQQQALYAQGRTAPGRRVTNCDGIRKRSKHQDGLAVDCAFVADDIWVGPWDEYGVVAEAHGLEWGGRWPKVITDRPHIQMSV